ncbi:hypothetical protein [Vibrio genomosp. F10]|uniref:hypothetical protein n=1 Tax=Vibrio genomosp. F10 TaxID=723171 RepID=UPI0003069A7B|nr:hypothetical protein [Vibrio genomosp. F10]OEF04596.1 hypothetical protein A1QI_11055 [Vibrio genomosp. F10 str. 9ZB36]
MNFKEMKGKVEKLAEKAKDGVDVDSIKKSTKEAKSNMTAENLKGLDNKKKAMLGGGSVAVILLLGAVFSGGALSVSNVELTDTYPLDASKDEQCEFGSQYDMKIMEMAANGATAEEIKTAFSSTHSKTASEVKFRTPEYYFYDQIGKAIKKVDGLVASVGTDEYQSMPDSKIISKIEYQGNKYKKMCIAQTKI